MVVPVCATLACGCAPYYPGTIGPRRGDHVIFPRHGTTTVVALTRRTALARQAEREHNQSGDMT